MRILCLILASDTDPLYIEFQNQWRRYMNSHPSVDCVFYKGDPTLTEEAVMPDKNTLLLRISDSGTHGVLYPKTLMAFDYFLPKLDQYDFIYRPNVTSFVRLDGLVDWCESLPKKKACSAVVGHYNGLIFPAGAGFAITPDLVRRLCAVRPPEICVDDVTIGKSLADWGVKIIPAPRKDNGVMQKNIWHYRLKSDDRNWDICLFRALVDFFYPTK